MQIYCPCFLDTIVFLVYDSEFLQEFVCFDEDQPVVFLNFVQILRMCPKVSRTSEVVDSKSQNLYTEKSTWRNGVQGYFRICGWSTMNITINNTKNRTQTYVRFLISPGKEVSNK